LKCQGGKVVESWISIPATRVRLLPGYLPQKTHNIKTAQCAFQDFESQGVLKKKFYFQSKNVLFTKYFGLFMSMDEPYKFF